MIKSLQMKPSYTIPPPSQVTFVLWSLNLNPLLSRSKRAWSQKKLKLNHDKTEALMVGFAASRFVTPTQFIARTTYVKLDVLPTLFVIRRDLPRQIVLRGTLSARFKTTICHSFALTTIISFHSVPPPFFICVSPPSPRILFLPPPFPGRGVLRMQKLRSPLMRTQSCETFSL